MLKKNIKIIATSLILLLTLSAAALSTQYVGSVKSNKFHYPDCRAAKRIKAANKITFKSKQDAINQGYVSCGICHP